MNEIGRVAGISLIVLILLMLVFISGRRGDGCVAPVAGALVLPSSFGTNALSRVDELLRSGSRDSMTEGAFNAAEWIAAQLRKLEIPAIVDVFDEPSERGEPRIFRNIVASIPGSGAKHVLLLSHYDTKPGISANFVGANDGGSSTGLLLELAAWFKVRGSEKTLIFAFLDGEECLHDYSAHDGLHGSRRLASLMRARGVRLDAVILLDMIGDADFGITLPMNVTPRLKSLLFEAAHAQGLASRVKQVHYEILDDHQPFLHLNYPAINLIDFEYGSAPGLNDYWHTAEDTIDKLSPESLRMAGSLAVWMIEHL